MLSYLFYTWREKKCFLHLSCIILRMCYSMYTRGTVMGQYQMFPPSKGSSVPSNTWFGAVFIERYFTTVGQRSYFLSWHCSMKNFITSGPDVLQELRWVTTEWNVHRSLLSSPSHQRRQLESWRLGAIVFCTFRHLITVEFGPKWSLGEVNWKSVTMMRWVVRWRVTWFQCKRGICLVWPRKSHSVWFTLDLLFFA
jgi:hypothetical protein